MNRSHEIKRAICVAALALIGAGCSESPDATTVAAPVDPEPGLYRVTFSGAGPLKFAGKEQSGSVCLIESESASFPHKLVQDYYLLDARCTTKRMPREGNAIAGEIACPADPRLAQGANRFVYSGAVARDNVKVEVQMRFDAAIREESMTEAEAAQVRVAMKAIEHARFVIEAKRTGNCDRLPANATIGTNP